jgi:hypothetical protein
MTVYPGRAASRMVLPSPSKASVGIILLKISCRATSRETSLFSPCCGGGGGVVWGESAVPCPGMVHRVVPQLEDRGTERDQPLDSLTLLPHTSPPLSAPPVQKRTTSWPHLFHLLSDLWSLTGDRLNFRGLSVSWSRLCFSFEYLWSDLSSYSIYYWIEKHLFSCHLKYVLGLTIYLPGDYVQYIYCQSNSMYTTLTDLFISPRH